MNIKYEQNSYSILQSLKGNMLNYQKQYIQQTRHIHCNFAVSQPCNIFVDLVETLLLRLRGRLTIRNIKHKDTLKKKNHSN